MRKFIAIGVVLGSFASLAPAQDAAATAPATKPSTQPAAPAAGDVIDVKDAPEKLKGQEGVTVSVRGKVSEVFAGRSGITILNFEGINRRDFNAVIQKDNADAVKAGFGGDLDGKLKGQTIVVTGPVTLYRERPQIDVKTPDQIKVEAAAAKTKEE